MLPNPTTGHLQPYWPRPLQETPLPIADFRRPESRDIEPWSRPLSSAVHRAMRQRSAMVEILGTAPDAVRSNVTRFALSPGDSVELSGGALRELLGIDEISSRVLGRPELDLGVLVIQTQRVPLREMKGFSIALFPFPVIALNARSPSASRGQLRQPTPPPASYRFRTSSLGLPPCARRHDHRLSVNRCTDVPQGRIHRVPGAGSAGVTLLPLV